MSRTIKRIDLTSINDFYDQTQQQIRDTHSRIAKAKEDAVRAAKAESERRIQDAKREMERRMDQKADSVRADVRRQLDRMEEKHREQLHALSDQVYDQIHTLERKVNVKIKGLQGQIDDISKNVKSIFDNMAKTEETSAMTMEMARARLRDVELRVDLNRFASEKAAEVRRHLMNMESAPTAESRISAAHNVIQETFDLEEKALKEKLQHDAIVELTRQQLESVLHMVNQNRVVDTKDAEGNIVEIENNYWSHGDFEKIEAELKALQKEVESDDISLDEKRIKAINDRVDEVEKEITKISEESVAKAILSERRVEVAQDIVESMVNQGWKLKSEDGKASAGYMGGEENEDMREGFYAILEDPNLKQEVTIIVNPSEQANTNQLVVQRNDESPRTSKEYMRQLESILRQIEKSGYKASQPCEPSGGGDEVIREITSANQLRQAGAAEKLRRRI